MLTNAITLVNKNVDFVHDKHIGLFYFLAIVVLRLLLYLLPIDGDTQWSLLHWIHTIVRVMLSMPVSSNPRAVHLHYFPPQQRLP